MQKPSNPSCRNAWTKADVSHRSTWTKADIRNARKVILKPVLEALDYQLEHTVGENYKVMGLSRDITIKAGYWICHDDGTSGNAIDFVTKIDGKSFAQAMQILLGEMTITTQP